MCMRAVAYYHEFCMAPGKMQSLAAKHTRAYDTRCCLQIMYLVAKTLESSSGPATTYKLLRLTHRPMYNLSDDCS